MRRLRLLCGSSRAPSGASRWTLLSPLGPVKDAAGGLHLCTCVADVRAHVHASQSRDLVPLTVFLPFAIVASRPHLLRSNLECVILAVSLFPRTKALGRVAASRALCRRRLAWTVVIGHDWPTTTSSSSTRRWRPRRRSRRASVRWTEVRLTH